MRTESLYDAFLRADEAVRDQGTAKAALDAFDAEAMADVLASLTPDERTEHEERVRREFAEARQTYVDWLADF